MNRLITYFYVIFSLNLGAAYIGGVNNSQDHIANIKRFLEATSGKDILDGLEILNYTRKEHWSDSIKSNEFELFFAKLLDNYTSSKEMENLFENAIDVYFSSKTSQSLIFCPITNFAILLFFQADYTKLRHYYDKLKISFELVHDDSIKVILQKYLNLFNFLNLSTHNIWYLNCIIEKEFVTEEQKKYLIDKTISNIISNIDKWMESYINSGYEQVWIKIFRYVHNNIAEYKYVFDSLSNELENFNNNSLENEEKTRHVACSLSKMLKHIFKENKNHEKIKQLEFDEGFYDIKKNIESEFNISIKAKNLSLFDSVKYNAFKPEVISNNYYCFSAKNNGKELIFENISTGYNIHYNSGLKLPKAVIIEVYGGRSIGDRETKTLAPNQLKWMNNILIDNDIIYITLNLADFWENNINQEHMSKEMHDKIHRQINHFIYTIKNEPEKLAISQRHLFILNLIRKNNISCFLFGGSFGGRTSARHAQLYPDDCAGYITWAPDLAGIEGENNSISLENFFQSYIYPSNYINDLPSNKRFLFMHNFNDNRVNIESTLNFYKNATNYHKDINICIFPRGKEDDNSKYPGHSLAHEYKVALAILRLIEQGSLPKEINEWQYLYYKTHSARYYHNASGKDKFISYWLYLIENNVKYTDGDLKVIYLKYKILYAIKTSSDIRAILLDNYFDNIIDSFLMFANLENKVGIAKIVEKVDELFKQKPEFLNDLAEKLNIAMDDNEYEEIKAEGLILFDRIKEAELKSKGSIGDDRVLRELFNFFYE